MLYQEYFIIGTLPKGQPHKTKKQMEKKTKNKKPWNESNAKMETNSFLFFPVNGNGG